MTDLRNALHDLADAEPLAPLGSDLWQRGRATRRSAQVQWVAASIVVLAVVGAIALLGRVWIPPDPAGTPLAPEGALSTVVHSPTGPAAQWHADDGAHGSLAPDTGFERIGRVGIVRSRPGLLPVVVSAETGRHWLPVLPDVTDDFALGDPITVSPDGWRIAYPWVVSGTTTSETRAGVAVVDLRSGAVDRVTLTGRNQRPIRIEELSWSPNGTRLGWLGDEVVSWEDGGWSSRGPVVNVGAIAFDGTPLVSTNFVVEKGSRGSDAVTVDNTGRVFYLGNRRLWAFTDRGEEASWRLAGVDGNGWTSATLTRDGNDLVVGTGSTGYGEDLGTGVVHIDVSSRALVGTGPDSGTVAGRFEAWNGLGEAHSVAPVGFSPQGSLVAVVTPAAGENTLTVQTKNLRGGVRTLTHSADNLSDPLSVATDLADQPPIDAPEPDWPMSDERKVLLTLLAFAAVLLPGWIAVRLWRLRRRAAA